MLNIRRQHIDALSKRMQSGFASRMVRHLQQCFPAHFACLGESSSRALIESGIAKALHFHWQIETDVCKYIDLTMIFGPAFPDPQQHPWACQVLADPLANTASARLELLFMASLKYLEKYGDLEPWHTNT